MLYDRKSDTNMWLKTASEEGKWKLYSRYLGCFSPRIFSATFFLDQKQFSQEWERVVVGETKTLYFRVHVQGTL